MERYANRNGNSGVAAYQMGATSILVQFTTCAVYEYTYASAGAGNIESMKSLAISGSGLCSFIKRHVNKRYSRKIR
ncbi:hypothetical protein SAMN05216490_0646 [Mucilaginibacter mallensis]|uniref:KTSC domain-containing protein n=1 Tax=Mucilaginibacter mallensis TaxID=652787 RepID=A0A1H1PYE3_MUCMA|nr:hypothetical protein [Mucilaginibacter mallensis]SDS15997.1 hypothetical protein SAMN05216490_0646 [Mucilaginibacter mallensis]